MISDHDKYCTENKTRKCEKRDSGGSKTISDWVVRKGFGDEI